MVRSKFAVSIASAVCAAGIGASLAAGLNRWQHEASQGIAFDRTLHDFGKVGEGTYDCEFELSNDSQYPARVKEVRASCGCIAYQIGDPIVPPGGRTQVSLTINAHGLHPPTTLRKSVTVTVDADGREIVFQLGVAADVRPDVVVKPSSLDFAAGEDERTFLVKREMLDADAFTSAAVKSTAACMEISAVDVHPDETRVSVRVAREYATQFPSPVEFSFTKDGASRTIAVPVRIQSTGSGGVTPGSYVAVVDRRWTDDQLRERSAKQFQVATNGTGSIRDVSVVSRVGVAGDSCIIARKTGSDSFEIAVAEMPTESVTSAFVNVTYGEGGALREARVKALVVWQPQAAALRREQ